MFSLNFDKFLRDNRLQQVDLLFTGLTAAGISYMVKRGRIKATILRRLEEKFGSLEKYLVIKKNRSTADKEER